MQPRQPIRSSTRRSSRPKGLTIIELLVTMGILAIILGASFSLVISNRRIYQIDQSRTAINQNLRSGMDILAADVRQAGERLSVSGTLPLLEVINAAGATPETLVIRRNLSDTILPVCADVATNATSITVAFAPGSPNTTPAECVFKDNGSPTNPTAPNGTADNVDDWRTYRLAQTGGTRAFIWDPVLKQGEFFTYTGETPTAITKNNVNLTYAYPRANQPVVYLLEEKRYSVNNGILQVVKNGVVSNPDQIIDRVSDFQIQATLTYTKNSVTTTTTLDTLGPTTTWTTQGTTLVAWQYLTAVNITLTGSATVQGRTVPRSLSDRLFPRNMLSQ